MATRAYLVATYRKQGIQDERAGIYAIGVYSDYESARDAYMEAEHKTIDTLKGKELQKVIFPIEIDGDPAETYVGGFGKKNDADIEEAKGETLKTAVALQKELAKLDDEYSSFLDRLEEFYWHAYSKKILRPDKINECRFNSADAFTEVAKAKRHAQHIIMTVINGVEV